MSNLKFAETHNLVLFLEKPKESDGFEGIIDFLNASSIRYALTIQALVDGKKVIVTKTSMRRALQLKDAKGTECLPNATIFEQLTLMSAETTAWNEFSSTMASAGEVKFLMYPRSWKGGKEKDEGSVTRAEESSSKRAGIELEQERIKKKKIDDDQEEAEMKKHMDIVVDDEEIAVDAIPLATKPPIIID
ncbi:hypothetical protein Tco_1276122 [Tanacetum coccineum]